MKLPRLQKTCAACRAPFEVPAKRRSRKYCSVRCAVDDPAKRRALSEKMLARSETSHADLVKTCPCGKVFTCGYRAVKRQYCNLRCRPVTPAMSKAWSDSAHRREFGGKTSSHRIDYTKKDGVVVHLQSRFEERLATSLDAHDVEWARPAPMDWVDEVGKSHRYYADFFLPAHGVFLDPKNNFLILKDAPKIQAVQAQNGVRILVLDATSLSWQAVQALL